MMPFSRVHAALLSLLTLTGCAHKARNSIDPFEPFNRKIYAFNESLDKILLKPAAKTYKAVVPGRIRLGINNAFNNLELITTVPNDLLQAEGRWAIKDSWRFIVNSSLGIGGLLDVAKKFSLPYHYTDLGVTFAKWGDRNSPYLVIPLLGPSTLRDGAGWLFQFALYSPYVYIKNDNVVYSLLALRLVDLRSQLLETDPIMDQALDKYAFMRDAYLQHRSYLLSGGTGALLQQEQPDPAQSLYVDE